MMAIEPHRVRASGVEKALERAELRALVLPPE
jgi:hypothetical protein